jgi:tRNA (guanine-N7-)-methyltransferase
MPRNSIFSLADRDLGLDQITLPVDLETLVPQDGEWEVELGFGKGRYLLRSAQEHPERRYLGIELVSKYYRLLLNRARKRQLQNLVVVRGEALYLLSTVLPRGFASALHVYFPDPWHKNKHNKRRMFDPETVDLVLSVLRPGGDLFFATDYLEYGELVTEILQSHPDLEVELLEEPWPDGARTNYEAKFIVEGRPILRLRARLAATVDRPALHPDGEKGIVAAVSPHS